MSPLVLVAILIGVALLLGGPGWAYYQGHGPVVLVPSLGVIVGVLLLLWACGLLRPLP